MDSEPAGIAQCIELSGQQLGFPDVTKEQFQAVKAFVEGRDVFVSLPTGAGKSLCFALLPLVFDSFHQQSGSIAVIVSPLIALMQDQVSSFSTKGLSAVYASCTEENNFSNIECGSYQLIFISPEALITNLRWRELLQSDIYRKKLVALVIDEAHCVTKWGSYFRREFSRLGEVRSLIPSNVNVMALTATATIETRSKIVKILGMKDPYVMAVSPEKPNITYWVKEKSSLEKTFMPLIRKLFVLRRKMPRTLIYCRSHADCGLLYQLFRDSLGRYNDRASRIT